MSSREAGKLTRNDVPDVASMEKQPHGFYAVVPFLSHPHWVPRRIRNATIDSEKDQIYHIQLVETDYRENEIARGKTSHILVGGNIQDPIVETRDEFRELVGLISNSVQPTSPDIWICCFNWLESGRYIDNFR